MNDAIDNKNKWWFICEDKCHPIPNRDLGQHGKEKICICGRKMKPLKKYNGECELRGGLR